MEVRHKPEQLSNSTHTVCRPIWIKNHTIELVCVWSNVTSMTVPACEFRGSLKLLSIEFVLGGIYHFANELGMAKQKADENRLKGWRGKHWYFRLVDINAVCFMKLCDEECLYFLNFPCKKKDFARGMEPCECFWTIKNAIFVFWVRNLVFSVFLQLPLKLFISKVLVFLVFLSSSISQCWCEMWLHIYFINLFQFNLEF